MTLPTAFTELAGVRHPVALAPMGGVAVGRLAAAVSEAGGRAPWPPPATASTPSRSGEAGARLATPPTH
ncbi:MULTISPECIES: hypothetical protein [Streptomycetaceae]|uniref:2-nitropropane dioxygenase n=1 Tax=Streptantibioticus cattleyicolor (strain ATCC 35852 / DSM 46488 / JCM 4925 / NBRC 14057 / NRRL 8057) TaxID=1003195 RepID=F8JV55_STREN|nr:MULTISPECIES: hypothetical protein [Streptomycetaceae]AEW93138.1 hypothetical protein SCATT_07670 [Streptantibioticus cattleyicolor NRRL 8057 = DSM 46488]MYS57865.1 hypothetical protein [Streptomyces sp. SID5468]CCB73496.1 protein of unknown function [Streptantibioticus cattleyicolor NRRL 8057 = DSM 46488]